MSSPYYTRSKAVAGWKSAGVLPFALSPYSTLRSGCEIVVLLGAERTRTGPKGKTWTYMWRDFGGAREAADADSAATAAREFAEETLGLFGGASVDEYSVRSSTASMAQRLRDPLKAMRVVHQLRKGEYHMFVTQTCLMSPLMFRLATQQNEASGAVPGGEKSAFAWVPLPDLLYAVGEARRRYRVTCRASVSGGRGTPAACGYGQRCFLLHPCFASSLRLAQAGGLLELLARAEVLPLPPAPPFSTARLPLDDEREAEAGAACDSNNDSGSESGGSGPEGPMPEHMTYWLAQKGIAQELRRAGEAVPGELGVACGAPGAAAGVAAVAEATGAALGAAAEPARSHTSSASGLAPGVSVSLEGSSSAAGRACARAAAAAAVAKVVAVAALKQMAGEQGGLGGRGGRHRSRKQRQLQRQRRKREQQRQREQAEQQQAAGEGEGERRGGPGRWSQPASSGQSQRQHRQQEELWQPQQLLHRAESTAGSSGWEQSSSTEGQDPSRRQQQAADDAGVPQPPPPQPPPPPLGHVSCYWAVAQDRLAKLLGPHTNPRKRIKLD